MISGYLIGDKELVAKIGRVPDALKAGVDATVRRLGLDLQATVKRDWLRGPRPARLGIVTGRLAGSIATRFVSGPTYAYSFVGTNVPYGIMWELTGHPSYDVYPVNRKALKFDVGGETVFAMHAHIPGKPPRPFLKPALAQMRPVIIQQLQKCLTDAVAQITK